MLGYTKSYVSVVICMNTNTQCKKLVFDVSARGNVSEAIRQGFLALDEEMMKGENESMFTAHH